MQLLTPRSPLNPPSIAPRILRCAKRRPPPLPAGSNVAINSASIALLNNDLSRLPFLIRLSRAATKVVWQNILFGVAFIVVMMTLAIWGPLTAVIAAMAHTLATAVVLFNSARLFRFGETRADEAAFYIGHLIPEPAVAA